MSVGVVCDEGREFPVRIFNFPKDVFQSRSGDFEEHCRQVLEWLKRDTQHVWLLCERDDRMELNRIFDHPANGIQAAIRYALGTNDVVSEVVGEVTPCPKRGRVLRVRYVPPSPDGEICDPGFSALLNPLDEAIKNMPLPARQKFIESVTDGALNHGMKKRDDAGMRKPRRDGPPAKPALSLPAFRGYSESFLGWPAANCRKED